MRVLATSLLLVLSAPLAAAITDDLRQREYDFSQRESGAWTAPNRSSNLRSIIRHSGVEVVPRVATGNDFRLNLALESYGREGCLEPLHAVPPMAVDNRVELARPGLVEWYVNDTRGLEQGFDLHWRPGCDDPSRPVVLDMHMGTDLHRRLTNDGRTIEFRRAGSGLVVLRYADLLVLDAKGRSLPATLRIAADRLRIEIDDRNTVYPLTVDPLLDTVAWDKEGDQDLADLAFQAATTAGDVNGDGYDDVIVGSDYWDNGVSNAGAAWVYHGSATGLSTEPGWMAEGNQADAGFGLFVSPAGDVDGDGYDDVLVAAPYMDRLFPFPTENVGEVFLYRGSPAGLEATHSWSAEGGSGCEGESFSYTFPYGCMAVFRPAHGDFNGDGYEDVVVVSFSFLGSSPSDWGQVRVYYGSSSGLPPQPSWTWDSPTPDCGHGGSSAGDVNGDGYDDVVISDPCYGNGESFEGRILIYPGSTNGLSTTFSQEIESNVNGAELGAQWQGPTGAGDVNGDGFDDVIAGAWQYANGESGEGAVFVWLGSSAGLIDPPHFSFEGDQQNPGSPNPAWVGIVVGPAGDVNGDGYDDVVFGSPTYDDDDGRETGRLWVFHGGQGGLGMSEDWSVLGLGDKRVGSAASGAGDVNGDGYGDLIAGWLWWSNPEQSEGRATVWYGFCDGDDLDGDGRCTGVPTFDCDDGDGGIWSTPGEVADLLFTDRTTLSWSVPQEPGAQSVVYDTLRSSSSADFSAASCVESNDGSDTVVTVADDPSPGQLHSFLVRAENDCPAGQGSLGSDSAGAPRSSVSCP